MGLSSAVLWWEEWQMRILVLGSLFLQFILYFSYYVRTNPVLREFRVVVWIAYIGSDALAIYGLATLFNRQQWEEDAGSTPLEVIWAPVLLIHLGGQVAITAYSLEDNELWRRHAITLVSQVTVALYVFFKWWSEAERLHVVAALLFVSGVIKFVQKPQALEKASFNSMLDSIAIDPRREVPGNTTWCWTKCNSMILEDKALARGSALEEEEQEHLDIVLEEYVQQAKKYVHIVCSDQAGSPTLEVDDVCKMFIDVSATYSDRLTKLQYFLRFDDKKTTYLLENCLRYTFQLLYTKTKTVRTSILYCIGFVILPCLALASLVLFALSHEYSDTDHGYNEDVWVTYILLSCNVVQELLPYFGLFLEFSCLQDCWDRTVISLFICFCSRDARQDTVSQYNLLSSVARTKKPTIHMKLATFNCLRRYINKHWYIWQVNASRSITGLVLRYVEDGWKEYISDPASYRRFGNLRGQWTLHRLGLERGQRQGLAWSFKVAFDRSVLLWHIATDLCFHHPSTSTRGDAAATQRSREISNYMIYLIFIRPEMLLPGTRPGLFNIASYVLEEALKDNKAPLDKERSLAQEITDMVKSSAEAPGYLIQSACRLTKALMELDDEERRWHVIQGVWVEMLCYSAARCRGYLHSKSLGEGVEYLSYVWLLWSYMGMETFADKFQKPQEPPEAEEEIAPTRASSFPSDSKQTEEEISSPV